MNFGIKRIWDTLRYKTMHNSKLKYIATRP